MNSTIYLFGNLGQGITLYPNDYTKNIFKEFISRANAPTQLIIHRVVVRGVLLVFEVLQERRLDADVEAPTLAIAKRHTRDF